MYRWDLIIICRKTVFFLPIILVQDCVYHFYPHNLTKVVTSAAVAAWSGWPSELQSSHCHFLDAGVCWLAQAVAAVYFGPHVDMDVETNEAVESGWKQLPYILFDWSQDHDQRVIDVNYIRFEKKDKG